MLPFPLDTFWTRTTEELLAGLTANRHGLTTADAVEKLATFGRNVVIEAPRRHVLAKITKRLFEPLIAIFIVAATISGAMGDWASSIIILIILAISIVLEVVQEHRAEITAEQLRRSVAVRTAVHRDSQILELPVEEIVPGDVVDLRAGDLVPADGIVLESRGAHVNESLLTGEAYPAEKRIGTCTAAIPADAFNALFGGTSVVSGAVTMLVIATGAHTRYGGIAAALRSDEPPTAFERGLRSFGILILRLTGFLALFVLLAHLAFGRPVLESFLFVVALAIGLTPELLPMIMTVTLSRGALRLAQRRVVVKRLAAIHDFGAMDVLCTDKTGTLTEAQIKLINTPGINGSDSDRILELAAINSRFEKGIKSPLDDAVLARTKHLPLTEWRRIASAPFDFERRRVSVLAEKNGRRFLVVKGAPEDVLARSILVELDDGTTPLMDERARSRLLSTHDEKAAEGLRCLGVGWRELPAQQEQISGVDEKDLVFAGYCVFEDPPKTSAADAIVRLEHLGVQVKIVSGDAPLVIRHLVKTLKLPCRGLLNGAEIDQLNDIALADRIEKVDLFARITPDQKTRIVRALQAAGHTVGYMGDGINDAPAIRAADVGISVDDATDVARAAADMILLAPDLNVLTDGVQEGRRTYANIMKYIRMGTSSNFGNMLSMALASLVIPFLPLTPIQVLLNDLLYEISETGIPFDRIDQTDVAKPHSWDSSAILHFTLIMGPLSSAFDIAIFAILILALDAQPETFRTVWFVESISTQILVIFMIRTISPAWVSRPHPVLITTSMGALVAAWAISLTPLGNIFGFVPLSWHLVAVIVLLAASYLILAEVLKKFAMRT